MVTSTCNHNKNLNVYFFFQRRKNKAFELVRKLYTQAIDFNLTTTYDVEL